MNKLDIVHLIIVILVGAENGLADRIVQFDVFGFGKVLRDGVKQLRKFGPGQRLGGMVGVESRENVVDLCRFAGCQGDGVRRIYTEIRHIYKRSI